MNKFIYLSKNTYDAYYPIFYVIDTELTYDEVMMFINNEAQKHVDNHYIKNKKKIDDEYGVTFKVYINNREYSFCLGDHIGIISYDVLFKYHDFMANHKMKINLENIV